jgi:hypothetical protein
MKRLALVLIPAALACQNPLMVRPDQDFTLAMGDRAVVRDAGFTLTFDSVPSDSRCPINALCITAGNAEVRLVVRFGPPGSAAPDLLLTLNTTIDPHAQRVGGFLVQLLALDPQPVAGQPPPMQYRASLRVSTLGAVP